MSRHDQEQLAELKKAYEEIKTLASGRGSYHNPGDSVEMVQQQQPQNIMPITNISSIREVNSNGGGNRQTARDLQILSQEEILKSGAVSPQLAETLNLNDTIVSSQKNGTHQRTGANSKSSTSSKLRASAQVYRIGANANGSKYKNL